MEENSTKQAVILFALISIAVIGLVGYTVYDNFFAGQQSKEEVISMVIPDGEAQHLSDSKSAAYRDKNSISTEAYFENLESIVIDEDLSLVSQPLEQKSMHTEQENIMTDKTSATIRVFGDLPEDEPIKQKRNTSPVFSRMTNEEKLEYDRKRMEMVKEVLTAETNGESSTEEDTTVKATEKLDFGQFSETEGIITSLDDESNDKAIRYNSDLKKPFKCIFIRNQKVRNGQRISVRLLEDYIENGIRIPANTHLSAICKISNRLELDVSSLEMNGRIIPLKLQAYDTDGILGIYCPETTASKESKKAASSMTAVAGSALGGLVGNIANSVLRTGATVAKSISGEVSVNISSGYEFFLVKSTRK